MTRNSQPTRPVHAPPEIGPVGRGLYRVRGQAVDLELTAITPPAATLESLSARVDILRLSQMRENNPNLAHAFMTAAGIVALKRGLCWAEGAELLAAKDQALFDDCRKKILAKG